MFNKFPIWGIQLLILLLETASNLIRPEYSVKVINTENVILSLGDIDVDTNDDLEIIKTHPGDSLLEKKLYEFHKYVNLAEKTERPKLKEFKPPNDFYVALPRYPATYPDSPHEIAEDEKHLSMLERRNKIRPKKNRPKRGAGPKFDVPEQNRQSKRDVFLALRLGDIEEYDYMENEYLNYIEQSKNNTNAFNYSDQGKPEESLKDVFTKITDFKTPKNCTNVKGIGVQAIECILKNFRNGVIDKKQMLHSISTILLFWICVYLAIAITLWCSRGWCCCCCRCGFCFPTERVRDIQKYISENPPGVYKTPKGVIEHYNPTQKEIELFERIKRSIAEF